MPKPTFRLQLDNYYRPACRLLNRTLRGIIIFKSPRLPTLFTYFILLVGNFRKSILFDISFSPDFYLSPFLYLPCPDASVFLNEFCLNRRQFTSFLILLLFLCPASYSISVSFCLPFFILCLLALFPRTLKLCFSFHRYLVVLLCLLVFSCLAP